MRTKIRINLTINKEIYNETKRVCSTLGMSVSAITEQMYRLMFVEQITDFQDALKQTTLAIMTTLPKDKFKLPKVKKNVRTRKTKKKS